MLACFQQGSEMARYGSVAARGCLLMFGVGVVQELLYEILDRNVLVGKAEFISSGFDFGVFERDLGSLL